MPNDDDKRNAQVMHLMRSITHEMHNQLNAVVSEEFGLTLPQVIVLRVINSQPEPPISTEVAELVHLAPSTVSGIIKRLQRDGLVQRREDDRDLRVHRLAVTDIGKELVEKADANYYKHIQSKLGQLAPEEIDALTVLLEKLNAVVCPCSHK